MRTREHLDAVIKAYDVRGVVGEDIDENFVRDTGAAFAAILREEGENTVAVGHDMRPSSPSLARAFAEGVTSQGLNVTLLGLTSTDELYYAAGSLECAGAMFTASHNPAKYNGIKLCRAGAVPVGQETGLEQIKQMLIDGTPEFTGTEGAIAEQEILAGYADFLRKLVPLEDSKPLVVAVDAANGMGGHTVPAVFDGLPFDVRDLYFELDGTFPNHEANPLDPKNLVDLQKFTVDQRADIGLAFDGDADRCLAVDAEGNVVDGDQIMALLAVGMKEDNDLRFNTLVATVMSNLGLTLAMEEQGIEVRHAAVGDRYVLEELHRGDFSLGGEQSGHVVLPDDCTTGDGTLTGLSIMARMAKSGKSLKELASVMTVLPQVLINVPVSDKGVIMDAPEVQEAIAQAEEELGETGRVLLRPSGTEEVFRVMVEAADKEQARKVAGRLSAIVSSV